jgi:sphingomyelin phosphodiesterase
MWLSEEESDVFRDFGYYSKPLKFNPKGRIISLNTNVCNDEDWFLLNERFDVGKHLEWLEKELSSLEEIGGFAYIIGHIHPRSCLHQFGVRFHSLMERYQHIVRFSSFGHSHEETFFITKGFNSV